MARITARHAGLGGERAILAPHTNVRLGSLTLHLVEADVHDPDVLQRKLRGYGTVGTRHPTPNLPAGQGNLTGTGALAFVQRATALRHLKAPAATPNPAGASPNALLPPPRAPPDHRAGPSDVTVPLAKQH